MSINADNLIELHEGLERFANHHQNKGGQKSHAIIKEMLNEWGDEPSEGSEDDKLISQGYKRAYQDILSMLHEKFVP